MMSRNKKMPYPVAMISEVNLSQNACSPRRHSNPKKKKKNIVAAETVSTIV